MDKIGENCKKSDHNIDLSSYQGSYLKTFIFIILQVWGHPVLAVRLRRPQSSALASKEWPPGLARSIASPCRFAVD
jgi:hypothetical protein